MLLSSLRAGFRFLSFPSSSSSSQRVKTCATTALLLFSCSSFVPSVSALAASSSSSLDSSSCSRTTMSTPESSTSTALQVVQFPCLSDNYGYLLHCPLSGQTAAIDTPDAQAIQAQLQQRGWTLSHIWNTHHHHDHTGGNSALVQSSPKLHVYGPKTERIPHMTHPVDDGDVLEFGQDKIPVQILNVGGHTKGHIAYYVAPRENNENKEDETPLLFCGDALFAMGCGRMFEGTPSQFWTSLQKLRALPDATLVHCAHEYTQANAKFALSVEPHNAALQARAREIQSLRSQDRPTVPSVLGEEKATNPFLRVDVSDEIRTSVGASATEDPVEVFRLVRLAKDQFRG